MKGEGNKTRLTGDEPWEAMLGLVGRVAELKCISINGNKQEELEVTVWQANYDLIAITETWWDHIH